MIRFAIVTPTIGRETLFRGLAMMRSVILKTFYDYVQIVVGDGPQMTWVGDCCRKEPRVRYLETPEREGFYGTAPRNFALEAIERGDFGPIDYILFLDDDNLLLEPALYNLSGTIHEKDRPPLLYQDILFTNKYKTLYHLMPESGRVPMEGDWDSLNGIYRADVIRGLRWKAVYRHDFLFSQEAAERAGNARWIKVPGVGAVHCVSWDTYEPERKDP